ncbi:MAG: type II secretion system F family protein [Xanthobacteraceae bacterium]
MLDSVPLLVALLSFGTVAAIAFVVGQQILTQSRIQRRLTTPVDASASGTERAPKSLDAFITRYFNEQRFGVDDSLRGKLRRELIRAGFFRNDAINYYIFARIAAVIVLPGMAYFAITAFMPATKFAWLLKLLVISISLLVAVFGPDVYLARRHRALIADYRRSFPDLLDLLVVCVDSGLSLEAALNRITDEILKQNRALGSNLLMLGAEIRAGRSTVEALASFADRLGLDEARSFALVLRQSVELGSDIGDALRVFSDEMRDRRLLLAEERANKLPVKMVFPMALLIFPVIMGMIMIPLAIRVIAAVVR